MWIVEYTPIYNFGVPDYRQFHSYEEAKTWAASCGYWSTWHGKTRCKIYKKELGNDQA